MIVPIAVIMENVGFTITGQSVLVVSMVAQINDLFQINITTPKKVCPYGTFL